MLLRCKLCGGHGTLLSAIIEKLPKDEASATPCKSCKGLGYIIDEDQLDGTDRLVSNMLAFFCCGSCKNRNSEMIEDADIGIGYYCPIAQSNVAIGHYCKHYR